MYGEIPFVFPLGLVKLAKDGDKDILEYPEITDTQL
jgi:hypothetical protein